MTWIDLLLIVLLIANIIQVFFRKPKPQTHEMLKQVRKSCRKGLIDLDEARKITRILMVDFNRGMENIPTFNKKSQTGRYSPPNRPNEDD